MSRTPLLRCLPILLLSAATTLVGGCGGGTAGNAAAVTTPTPQAVSSVLAIAFSALPNYVSPPLPAYFDATVDARDNQNNGNRVSDAGATLGRVLFYDKSLSFNNAVSCASCHLQSAGFSDPQRFSTGFSGSAFTTAHSMRLVNARYFRPGTAFWDRRSASLEAQASQPILNAVEMGFDSTHGGMPALLAKLQALTYYPELFALAFGDRNITEARVQQAIAQFERSMISSNSRWDTGYASTFQPAAPDRGLSADVPGLTVQENRGRALFMLGIGQGGVGCASCHVPPTFALNGNSRSNGLDAGETTVFKSPSLKSVALAGAFMHDGRFSSLAQVVEHYNSGVQAGPALDNRLLGPGGAPRQLGLSASDKAALVAFMETLTDTTLQSDPRFSNPFRP